MPRRRRSRARPGRACERSRSATGVVGSATRGIALVVRLAPVVRQDPVQAARPRGATSMPAQVAVDRARRALAAGDGVDQELGCRRPGRRPRRRRPRASSAASGSSASAGRARSARRRRARGRGSTGPGPGRRRAAPCRTGSLTRVGSSKTGAKRRSSSKTRRQRWNSTPVTRPVGVALDLHRAPAVQPLDPLLVALDGSRRRRPASPPASRARPGCTALTSACRSAVRATS